MPRERINSAGYRMFDILVGWDKESGYAQIGIAQHPDDEPSLRVGESGQIYDSVWADLSAENIDQLIKVLRKAKRQALTVK